MTAQAAAAHDDSIVATKQRLTTTFRQGRTRDLRWRREQLAALSAWLRTEEPAILAALRADLGRPDLESYAAEVGFTLAEIRHTLAHLESWAAPQRTPGALVNLPSRSHLHWQPKGVVLIIAPWNYPIQLALAPLVAAIGAGCCAVVKPSELAPASSALLASHLPRVLDASAVAVVEGAADTATALLDLPWDHIFFTGSTRIGRVVAAAAARHLSPVTLELGGKSPVIVTAQADVELAARRVAWGKGMNAGQTCIAPDYVLVERAVEERFVTALAAAFRRFYGKDPARSPDLGRIISAAHHARLVRLLGGGRVSYGGQHDATTRFVAPTILREVDLDHALMQEEIFGPLLPIVPVGDLDEAFAFVSARPHPLALYLFSDAGHEMDRTLAATLSGGVCVNDVISHIAVPDLPFGGVGESGQGAYHGEWGFRTFSHGRAVVQRFGFADAPIRYPPYQGNMKWIKMLMR